jgi:hypothetical protein
MGRTYIKLNLKVLSYCLWGAPLKEDFYEKD